MVGSHPHRRAAGRRMVGYWCIDRRRRVLRSDARRVVSRRERAGALPRGHLGRSAVARQASEITAKVGAKRLIDIAGSPLVTGFMAATAAWMREERASIWWRTKRLLSPKDEIRRRMTGVTATDPGDGSASLLFDARWRNWSPDLLDAVEVPSILLPPVKPSSAVAGEITQGAAEALGLAQGTPVVTGTGDAPGGLLGAGIVDPATMLLSLSTGAQVMVPDDAFQPDLGGRTHAFCSALEPGRDDRGGTRWGQPSLPAWHCAGSVTRCCSCRRQEPTSE